MLLAETDWATVKDIVQIVMGGVTLLLTTLGAAWAIYIGYRTKAIELAAEAAKLEAKKQGRRMNRRAKTLTDETVRLTEETKQQTQMIGAVQAHVEKVDKQTNGMKEDLVRLSHEEGKRLGATEEKGRIAEVAAEVAAKVAEKIAPTPVVITNQEPIQVHDIGEQKP